jgi:SAM-dependent methyltransferase
MSVLEVGCGQGYLLAGLSPERGVGVDFSDEMLSRARQAHPELTFHSSLDEIQTDETFDFIVLSDILNDVWDVQSTLDSVRRFCRPETRVAINLCSHLWEWPHKLSQKLGAATPLLTQNWLTVEDLSSMLRLANFEMIRAWPEVLWPIVTPGLDSLCNRWLVRFWPFRHFALTNFVVARPVDLEPVKPATVSVIVPARNESGNIEGILSRVPTMGAGTELIFVEGNSTDDTYEKIEQTVRKFPHMLSKLLKQTGRGKGDAVRLGFSHAQGEILMILDADLTVPPEDLPRFYDALVSGKAEYVNGVRLVYPMEKQAMRFFNLIGNKFFSLAFSWILGQTIKDTLCGTKVLRKVHYEKIAANRSYFGDFDPFGDFDLIFGAAKANMKMLDLPIRYRERTYGDTNISRWRHGWLLLRMVVFALNRIKFV